MSLVLLSPPKHPYLRQKTFDADAIAGFTLQQVCPACGSADAGKAVLGLGQREPQRHIRLDECGSCGHIYYANPPSEDSIARFYAEEWNSEREAHATMAPHAKKLDKRVAKLASAIGDLRFERPILEVGCGTGAMLAGMQAAGFSELYGTEASNNRARLSETKFPGRIFRNGLKEIPADLRFQLIYSHHVMEHMSEPATALAWMRDRLLPGGRIAVIVPDANVEPVLSQALFLPHLHSFSRRSLIMMGRAAGLAAAEWKSPHGEAEIAVVFFRPDEAGGLRDNSAFTFIADPQTVSLTSQRARLQSPFTAESGRKTVYLRLHHSERDQKKIAVSGGAEQAAPVGRLTTSLAMVILAQLRDSKFRRRLEKRLLRNRFVKATIIADNSDYPILSSENGQAPLHVK